MAKLLDEYEDILHEATYVTSEYKKWKTYECDQNSKEIKIEVDNKSVNKIPNFWIPFDNWCQNFLQARITITS